MSIIIRSVGKGLPERHCKNSDLPAELNTNDEWIVSHTGIKARYIANKNETSSSLGITACNNALKNAGILAEKINLLICTTTTPDYSGFPSTACIIQEKIGAKNATCFDISAACTGFIYALNNAKALMELNNWNYALICSSEVLSKICDWNDRSTCILFGDAAGAVLLERTDNQNQKGIGDFITGSDGSGANALYLGSNGFIQMDGHIVYDFAVGIMAKVIEEIMNKEKLSYEDVDFFVCHQANERILRAAAKRLNIGFEKFICTMSTYGNTSSASIPVTLTDMYQEEKIKEGSVIIFAAFGAGLTWAGTVIRF